MIRPAQKNAADPFFRLLAGFARGLVLMLSIAGAAHAEKADREKPINLEADRVSVDDAKQISTFEGRVVLTQASMLAFRDTFTVLVLICVLAFGVVAVMRGAKRPG